ncbi:16S rRNA processing protein RimM [Dysgonomonadaceae bacterium PH5-43]|nr:16S rRNA processing protein RimM [Dysgonomonadaceae bacterium PH5-43]
MINSEDIIRVGKLNKPHGIKGEMSFTYTDLYNQEQCPFLILNIDDIFVPFRVEEIRFTSAENALVKLKNINSDTQARQLTNKEVFFPKEFVNKPTDDDVYAWSYFEGFTIIDEKEGEIGQIDYVDESTINTIFIVNKDNKELLIPAIDEIITHIDEDNKKLYVILPEELLSIND